MKQYKCTKLLAVLLAMAMLLSMAACGSTAASSAASSAAAEETVSESAASAASVEETAEEPAAEEPAAEEPAEEAAPEEASSEAELAEAASLMEEAPEEAAEEEPAEEEVPIVVSRDPSKGQLLSEDATVSEIAANISPEMPTNLPLSDTGETITYLTEFNEKMYETIPGGYADCYPFQVAEELTGVHVEFREISSGTWTEQFSLIIAANDYPELVAAKTEYNGGDDKAIEDDFVLCLNDYLEEYMPNYYSILQTGDNMTQIMTDSGNVAAMYTINSGDSTSGTGTAFIRSDWLEKVGLDTPITYDDWYECLKAFQSQMGASEALMLPATIVASSEGLASGYGIAGNASIDQRGTNIPYFVVDGQVQYGLLTDGYYDFLTMIRQWYDEGLISNEFLTKNANSREATFIDTITMGDTGIFFIDNQEVENIIDMGVENDPDFAAEAIRDPVENDGDINHFASISSPSKACWVTTNTENIELVLNWCDFWYSQVGSDLCEWGLEGVTFTYNDDDTRSLTDFGESIFISSENRDLRTVYSLNNMGYVSLQKNNTDSEFVQKCDEIRKVNTDSAYTLPNISLTSDEATEHSALYSDISTYTNEMLPKFVMGEVDISEWDSFIQDLYDMGIEDCIAIYQNAYDRYLARTEQ